MPEYQAALDYLYSFANFETRPPGSLQAFDLGRVERLLRLLDNPQQKFLALHIAGTKGKGSTCSMLESILRQAGLRTGLYTSPHLHTFRERIQVEGKMISEQELVSAVASIKPFAAQVPDLTTFEVATALAFSYFAEKAIDIAVVEVGLGGRLDATNLLNPLVSVITPISYDHTAILGKKLEQIAREKAGIIKPHRPVVVAPQRPAAMTVIRRVAKEKSALLIPVDKVWQWKSKILDPTGQTFGLHNSLSFNELWVPLLGEHQLRNVATAVATISQLTSHGFTISPQQIAQGLARVSWPGRIEIINRNPLIIVDGAHNPESAKALVQTVRQYFPTRRIILIYGSLADKNHIQILRHLRHLSPRIILTLFRHPRSVSLPDLDRFAAQDKFPARLLIENVPSAVEQALALAQSQDLVLATGSIAFAGQVRRWWFKKKGWPLEEDPAAG